MALDPRIRRELAQTGRLWALALVCATAGAGTVWATDAVRPGVLAFLATLAVLGPLLFLSERRAKARRQP